MENKNVVPLIKTDYYACHNKTQWNVGKIHDALLGSWLWDSTKCSMSGKSSLSNANYKLIFIGDSKLYVYKNNMLHTEASWSITGKDNSFILRTEPFVERAYGSVYFCGDKVEFQNSWVDGCDFFYKKESN